MTKPRPATVWTPGRRWAGNLVPFVFWLPGTAYGLVRLAQAQSIVPEAVWSLVAGVGLGWIATNFAGAMSNRRMQGQLARILAAQGEAPAADAWFVGFASPKFSSMLDPHEDVGFLDWDKNKIRFRSESRTIEWLRGDVDEVNFRANIHTWVGLGRWVAIDAKLGGQPVRMLIEPRTRNTMLGNLAATGPLRRALMNCA